MRLAWTVIAALLVVPTSGCLDSQTASDLWTDLEARDQFEERSLYNDTVEFSPTGIVDPTSPPGGVEDAGTTWTGNFTVPDGTRQLTVLFSVNFSTTDAQEPLPTNPPDGDIQVFVRGAGNESQNLTTEEPIHAGFDFTSPTGGQWTLGFNARGQGSVNWDAIALVPVDRASDA